MRLKQFLYLQTVAECKSIAKASEKLFISHQALSYALRKLEESYGVILLSRTPQGVSLTAEGEKFLQISKQILTLNSELETIFTIPKKSISNLAGELRIIAPAKYNMTALPDIQYQLKKECPKISLSITAGDYLTLISEIHQKNKDIGYIYNITLNEINQTHLPDDIIFMPISQSQFVVVASKKIALSKKKTLSLKSALEYPIAFSKSDASEQIMYNVLRNIKEDFENFTADSELLYFRLLREGDMIAIEPESRVYQDMQAIYPKEIAIIPLRDKLVAEAGYVMHKDMLNNPLIQVFLQMNEKIYKNEAGT